MQHRVRQGFATSQVDIRSSFIRRYKAVFARLNQWLRRSKCPEGFTERSCVIPRKNALIDLPSTSALLKVIFPLTFNC